MAMFKMSYHQLLIMRAEIKKNSKESVSYSVFNAEKINKFYRAAKTLLQKADDKINALQALYAKKDGEGKVIKKNEVDGYAEIEFENEEDREDFNAEYKAFIEQTFDFPF